MQWLIDGVMNVPIPTWLQKLLIVDGSLLETQFSLNPGTKSRQDNDEEDVPPNEQDEEFKGRSRFAYHARNRQGFLGLGRTRRSTLLSEYKKQTGLDTHDENGANKAGAGEFLSTDLDRCKEILEDTFHIPLNKDVYIREFRIGIKREWRALAVFVDGMADKTIINTHILEPLMLLSQFSEANAPHRSEVIARSLLPGNQVQEVKKWSEAVQGILSGSTAVFVDECDSAFVVETKGWEHRMVGLAQTEIVVRGPKDAFTESFRANTGLIRSRLRSEHLITEMMSVGKLGRTDVAVMYIDGLTNPEIIREVKRRIGAVDVDFLADSGILEQFLEDNPYTLVPQVMSTERPDRIAQMLTEGQVAILVGNSPFALAVPVVLWSMVHTAEDSYIRFPYGTFLRLLRWLALMVAILLPALYISVTNYHPEMIPTDLMLAVAGSREQVPFPAIVELLLMEFCIELIREAGIRVPTVIGPTIGIVGALIIGQAAVQAGVVSPLLVIIVATTALASFTIPNYNLNLGVRILRFIFLAVAAMFGFYAMALLLVAIIVNLSIQKSFGVPLLAPIAPRMDTSPDALWRGPAFAMNERPSFLQTLQDWRQQPYTRPWSSTTRERSKGLGRKKGKSE